MCARTDVNKNKDIREHAGHKSKSCQPVRPHFTFGTLFLLLFNQNVKTLQEKTAFHLFTECMDGIFHKITE